MRTITIRGTGSVSTAPDYVKISMTVKTLHLVYKEAVKEADRRIGALQLAAEAAGFKKKDLKTVDFHVDSKYSRVEDRGGRYRDVFDGYQCTCKLRLSFDFDGKTLGNVLEAVSCCGAMPKIAIDFTVKHPEKVSDALLAAAAKDARRKAEVLCKASGCQLGTLLSVTYNWNELTITSGTDYQPPLAPGAPLRMSDMTPEDIESSDTAAFVWEIQ